MATHSIPKEESLDDFMAELDKDLKRPTRSEAAANRKKKAAEPAPFVQQWFPFGVQFLLSEQQCQCGAEFQHVEGIFLRDTTKNGVMRSVRYEGPLPLPEPYRYYAAAVQRMDLIHLQSCPWCYTASAMPEAKPVEHERPLSAEDREALRELDATLGDV